MDGKKTQGQGYLKKKASVSYLVEEEENDSDEEEEEKRKGVTDRFCGSNARGSSRLCQVDRCTADLKEAKQYHRRHKVCEVHAKASSVYLTGVKQRFCQQCSRYLTNANLQYVLQEAGFRFHELLEFDEAKRSCRKRLAGHNERRRKSSGESAGEGSGGRRGMTAQMIQNQERSRVEIALPMSNTSFKRSQIR
ncbi:Squamosa promoter-binding-like protein 4 [Hirschfeldia incana]|nr:Squamosa promoter-binding-like protein 4 [Hirschfeldia incana]